MKAIYAALLLFAAFACRAVDSSQKGAVFFLAGTYESTVTKRVCTVPAGKYLFFPIVNYVVMPAQCSNCAGCNLAARRFGVPPIAPSASNGYYLLLKPLSKGTHTLQFGAELPSLRQGLNYTLNVE